MPRSTTARASSSRGDAPGPWRALLATCFFLLLLSVLAGGIYYAAVGQKVAQVRQADQAARPAEGDQAQRPPEQPKANEGEAVAKADMPIPASLTTDDAKVPAQDQKAAGGETVGDNIAAAAVVPASAEPLGLYGERTRADRQTWIANVGGTPESELAVAGGLDWLTRHQAEDGHWGSDCLGRGETRCDQEHPCSGNGQRYEAAYTGLTVLALQAGGNYDFNGRPYSNHVRRGLDWLVARQGQQGEIVGSLNQIDPHGGAVRYEERYMYEHAIATFALAESCAVARAAGRHADERYLNAALKAIQFIESQQHDDGGWRYHPIKSEPGDASISGWSMLALKTAIEADLPVDKNVVSRMVAFFKSLEDPLTGRTHYQLNAFGTDALTGVGMMVDEFVVKQPNSELIQLGAPYLADEAKTRWGTGQKAQSDFYLWYNCTLAMFQAGGDPWNQWNDVIRNHIISLQLHGSDCVRGSWDPDSQWGGYAGRIYTTALAVLTLEVYYRFAREAVERPPTQK